MEKLQNSHSPVIAVYGSYPSALLKIATLGSNTTCQKLSLSLGSVQNVCSFIIGLFV